jgi:hypothetical protein
MPILGVIDSGKSGHLAEPNSYYSIATQTVGSGGASSITFSSIPSTYTHLQIRALLKTSSSAGSYIYPMRFNADSGSNYSNYYMRGNGSSVSATNGSSQASISFGDYPNSTNTNMFGVVIIDILDYANTNKYKTMRYLEGFDTNGSGQVNFGSSLWKSTSAISNISMADNYGNFAQYSSFALYGIK